jgi:hypothetical protein
MGTLMEVHAGSPEKTKTVAVRVVHERDQQVRSVSGPMTARDEDVMASIGDPLWDRVKKLILIELTRRARQSF